MTTLEFVGTATAHQFVVATRSSAPQKSAWASIVAALNVQVSVDDDAAWDASFARSQDFLARLADEALAERRAGRTEILDPDTL
jgi:hypothetical protein